MARILAYCDSPTAHTGFGRSAQHVLYALHEAGHTIVQLAVNHNPSTEDAIPWKVYSPTTRGQDPYGLQDLGAVIVSEPPFDLFWTTFDPEVPWSYVVPGIEPKATVLQLLHSLKATNPGFRMMIWVPIDGGPLSEYELATLGDQTQFDVVATMSAHVHELVSWTFKLKGLSPNMDEIRARVEVIPHGVDLDLYRIATDEERREAKARLGFPPDSFLVIQVERNQQRKDPWRALALMEILRRKHPNAYLYQHMDEDEETQNSFAGFRLRDLSWRYGLKADVDVRWRNQLYSEQDMVDVVYAAGDVLLSTSLGEGFQYPAWEALACGRRVVLPNDSARKAWLSNTPGAFLYRTDEHGQVVRGGYNRRMGAPDIADAAKIVGKMIEGKQKFRECGEASRSWVDRIASVDKIRHRWVTIAGEQLEALRAQRAAGGIRVQGGIEEGISDYVVGLRSNPGLGDVVLMAPALRKFKADAASRGETVTLALPGGPVYLMVAQWLELADFYQSQPTIKFDQLGKATLDVSSLWDPKHRRGWSDPAKHRTDVVAEFLDVDGVEPLQLRPDVEQVKQANAAFYERFGVHPSSCVVIAGQSGIAHRSIPDGFVKQLVERILSRGLTPIVVGTKPVDLQRVGAVNLTGQTDIPTLIMLLGTVGAVISTDSAPLHLAAIQGTPTVACFPTFPAASRLGYYQAQVEVLEPGVDQLGDEAWPPGKLPTSPPGTWAALITPDRIMGALDRLLDAGSENAPGETIAPADAGVGLGQAKVVTAADLGLEGVEK